jgi:CheY-like chemotaxis protein
MGLGLTLVKRLMEMHEGSVSVSSDGPGCGSQFTVRFPRVDAEQAPHRESRGKLPKPRRILVVDDQADVADSFAALLTVIGQDVCVAYNGESAINIAKKSSPTLAFLDLTMPDMDGHELATRLRKFFPPSQLYLIAFSGFLPKNASAETSPFQRYLLKPVNLNVLIEVLNSTDFEK